MDYVSDALPPDRLSEFERHLAVCPACVDYLRTYRATIRLSRAAFGPTEGENTLPHMPEALVRAILAARGGP